MHDHGRWAEERIFGAPGDSLIHARLNFLLGRELLDSLDMPRIVRDHILFAAIRHSSGANPEDLMPLKLTVAADRDQLYGPEIVLRLAHHPVGDAGEMGRFFGERPGRTVRDKLSFFLANRLPGPLFTRQAHVNELWQTLCSFLLMCEDPLASFERFTALERCRGRPMEKPDGSPFNWLTEWQKAQSLLPKAADPQRALQLLISAPHTVRSPAYRTRALVKLDKLPLDRMAPLAGALTFADEMRRSEELRQAGALREILDGNRGDAVVQTLGVLLQPSVVP